MSHAAYPKLKNHCTFLFAAALFLVAIAGCSRPLLDAQTMYRNGQVESAVTAMATYAERKGDSGHAVVVWLEYGGMLRALGQYDKSNQILGQAEQAIAEQDRQAEVRITEQAGALLTNQTAIDYRAQHYDRIMLHVYRALNAMTLNDRDLLRNEMFRIYQQQKNAVAENEKRIAKAKEELEERGKNVQGYNLARSFESDQMQAVLAERYAQVKELAGYADFVNPFAEYLQGIYFMHDQNSDGSDWERARLALTRAAAMVPANPYLQADLRTIEEQQTTGKTPALTYVIFETGTAAYRSEFRVDLPLFLLNDKVDYVGIALPTLAYNERFVRSLTVRADGKSYESDLVASMDRVIASEFDHDLPAIIARTLLSSATKAAMAYAANRATADDETLNALVRIGTSLYQAAYNQADLRCWASLPKQYQIVRLESPADRKIDIVLAGQSSQVVNLHPGHINVVIVKSVMPSRQALIEQFVLKK